MEQSPVVDPVAPTMEGPPAAGLTSVGEETWAMVGIAVDSARAGEEIVGHALGSIVQDPPSAIDHVTPAAS